MNCLRQNLFVLLFSCLSTISWGQLLNIGDVVTGPHVNQSNCELEYEITGRHLTYENGSPIQGSQVTSVTWFFGEDGTTLVKNAPLSTGDLTVLHAYNLSDTYTIDITVNTTAGTFTYQTDPFYAYGNLDNGILPTFSLLDLGGGVTEFTYTGYLFESTDLYPYHSYTIDWGDGSFASGNTMQTFVTTHGYSIPGTYTVTMTHDYYFYEYDEASGTYNIVKTCTWNYNASITVSEDPCCSNFAPEPNQRYWVSAWVLEDHPNQVKTYSDSYVEIEFLGGTSIPVKLYPTGDIIEGWQRIVGDFIVPNGATDLKLHLVNDNASIKAYFDDVRVHPFNASMKSYVYDPETLWLTAELDDNNYATFYEYDKEGQLIRIKKETARGIMTIQESRSSNPKPWIVNSLITDPDTPDNPDELAQ